MTPDIPTDTEPDRGAQVPAVPEQEVRFRIAWQSLRLSASALIVMGRFELPTELAVALAGEDETNAFEHAD